MLHNHQSAYGLKLYGLLRRPRVRRPAGIVQNFHERSHSFEVPAERSDRQVGHGARRLFGNHASDLRYRVTAFVRRAVGYAVQPIEHCLIIRVGGGYTIIAGTMSTAHDGELLGKKWSSIWIPIRTCIGTAAILPTMKGFCGAQAIVVWLAIQGIGLADIVWPQFASNPLCSDGQVYTGVDMTANVRKLATSLRP
jgi:hypothetical protein